MITYSFTVPPTKDVGSYSGTCSTGYCESYRRDALRDYNSCRAHDGLPPLDRMPAGTIYRPIRAWYVQRNGGGCLETVDEFPTRAEASAMVREYRTADPSAAYYLSSRPCTGWND